MSDPAMSDSAMRRWLFLVPLAVFAGLAGLFLIRLHSGDPARIPSVLIGKPAPAFALEPLPNLARNGAKVPGLSDSDLKTGKVTIVNIWASWCGPCREEHPVLMKLSQNPNVQVVGINYKDNPDNARRFLGALGNPYAAVGIDPSGRTAIDWGVYGVPETFVVGSDGTILHKKIGPLRDEEIERFLDESRKLGTR